MEGDFIRINKWLLPLSWLYGLGVRLRNTLFDIGVLKSESFDVPVISVGNITVGGTGKTPHVEYLIGLLRDKCRVAVLSRGYKRKSRGFVLADAGATARPVGDEPWQMKHKFPDVTVAVDADRRHGIRRLMERGGDGAAVAGLLLQRGWQVRCFLTGPREKMTVDCRSMAERLEGLGGTLEDYCPGNGEQIAWTMGADVVVDAIFGVGLHSPLRQPAASAVALINSAPGPVVSADMPSGVESDTGRILGDGVRAAVTVTFSLAKIGLGVAGVTLEFVQDALESGDIRLLKTDFEIPKRSVDMCTLRDVAPTAAASAFMEMVRQGHV